MKKIRKKFYENINWYVCYWQNIFLICIYESLMLFALIRGQENEKCAKIASGWALHVSNITIRNPGLISTQTSTVFSSGKNATISPAKGISHWVGWRNWFCTNGLRCVSIPTAGNENLDFVRYPHVFILAL